MDPAVRGRGGLGAALRAVAVCVAGAAGVPALTSCGEPAHAQDDGALYKALIGQPVGLKLATGETVAGTLLGVDAAVFLVQLPGGETKRVVRALVNDVQVGAAAGVPVAGAAALAPAPSRAAVPNGDGAARIRHGFEVGTFVGYKLSWKLDKGVLDAVALRAGVSPVVFMSTTAMVGFGPLGIQAEFGRKPTQFLLGVEFNAPIEEPVYFMYPMPLLGVQVDPDTPMELDLGIAFRVPYPYYLWRPHVSVGWVW